MLLIYTYLLVDFAGVARELQKQNKGHLELKRFMYQQIVPFRRHFAARIKVTVQFETEGNGQNEIVSHTDRLEVKL